MASKLSDLEKAAAKLPKYLLRGAAAAASGTVSMLMSIFTAVMIPALASLLREALKKNNAKEKYGKYLRPSRDFLNLTYPVEEDE